MHLILGKPSKTIRINCRFGWNVEGSKATAEGDSSFTITVEDDTVDMCTYTMFLMQALESNKSKILSTIERDVPEGSVKLDDIVIKMISCTYVDELSPPFDSVDDEPPATLDD